jgi:hypothetical protein
MNRRTTVLIVVALLLLSGVALYLHLSKTTGTTSGDESRAFAFKDTAAITRIFIADKEGSASDLRRTSRGWIVNDKYPCRSEAILNLLEVIRNVEVKMPVPRQAKEPVIRIMSAAALKVEIYAGDELVKQYYVGHETLDGEGSYMLLRDPETGRNYSEPYVCFIPGFMGYLQPRYIAKEQEWRDRLVINYIPPQISKVEMIHSGQPDSSFTIDLLSTTQFRMTDGRGKAVPFDEGQLKQYLAYLQNLSYEALITNLNPRLLDSLATAGPFCELTVTARPMRRDVYQFYRKSFAGMFDPEIGVKYDYDPDRLYMRFNGGREWAICQYFVFGKILQNSGYFLKRESVKK